MNEVAGSADVTVLPIVNRNHSSDNQQVFQSANNGAGAGNQRGESIVTQRSQEEGRASVLSQRSHRSNHLELEP